MSVAQRRVIQDYENNVVYLIQTPRAGCLPNLSPFALKLETWLRMADIQYQNVDNQFKYKSVEGYCPFVELDGRQIVDSNNIINELTVHFGIRMDEIALSGGTVGTVANGGHATNERWHENGYGGCESPTVNTLNRRFCTTNSNTVVIANDINSKKKLADFFAYRSLIEDTLRWKCKYYRAINNNFYGTNDGVGAHFRGFKKFFFKHFFLAWLRKKTMKACRAQGIGHLTSDKVDSFARRELKALSIFLGNNRYFLGQHYSTLDAIAFAHLCTFYYTPLHTSIRNYLESDCANLVDFLRNMKTEFWPDWAEATEKLSLTSRRHPPQASNNATVATVVAAEQKDADNETSFENPNAIV